MGKGERESVNTLCQKIEALTGALKKFPEIRANPDATSSLELIMDEFRTWTSRFVKDGEANA